MPSRSPALATFLSFLWPGLGQLYIGARRAALIFAPAAPRRAGRRRPSGARRRRGRAHRAADPIDRADGHDPHRPARRVAADLDGDALGTAGRRGAWRGRPHWPRSSSSPRSSSPPMPPPRAWPIRSTTPARTIFVGVQDPDGAPSRASSASPRWPPGQTRAYRRRRRRRRPPARINILLTGIDSSRHRSQALNDTLLVVSIDPATGTWRWSASRATCPACRRPTAGLQGQDQLADVYAAAHPERVPRRRDGGVDDEIGYLLGARIDYYASVDLEGFQKLIDKVGGVTVNVTKPINDPGYGGWDTPGKIGFKSRSASICSTARAPSPSCAAVSRPVTSTGPGASSSSSSRSSRSSSTRRCSRISPGS